MTYDLKTVVNVKKYILICLSKTRLSSWYVTPFFDNGLLDLSWVGTRSGANFLGDINTFFYGLEKRYQLGYVSANSLWFQITGFFGNLLDDGFFSVEAFFFSGNLGGTSSTDFSGNLFTFGFWAVFLYVFLVRLTLLYGPFGTFLFSGVTLSNIFTLFFCDGFTFYLVFLNIMLFITSGTGRFIDSLADFGAISFQDDWGVTECNCFFGSDLLVFNETTLEKVFFAIFFLCWLKISGVGGVTFLTVAMFASNNIVVFSFFNHYNFVDTSFTSGGNRSNVKSNFIISTASLTRITRIIYSVISMMIIMMSSMVVFMSGGLLTTAVSVVKWEGTAKVLTGTRARASLPKSACSDKENKTSLPKYMNGLVYKRYERLTLNFLYLKKLFFLNITFMG